MSFNFFVGIDVSKLTIDVFIREKQLHKQFENDADGFISLTRWLERQTGELMDSMLICFEHTGVYSLPLAVFLEERRIAFSMIPALEIKRSLGITRGKNDRIDSKRIAEFAYRFRDKVRPTKLPAKDVSKLQYLLNLRDRLSRNMGGYIVSRNEIRRALGDTGVLPELFVTYDKMIDAIKVEIKALEKVIRAIIRENDELRRTFELVTGIKGIGLIVACNLIVYTHNFTRFDDWRKFACYSGTAPFDYQSGTSIRGRTQVSAIANKQMKKMLHLAAMCAIHRDAEMREYYARRLADGKPKMSTINIVRNKLIARVFAVVKRGTPFVDIRRYAV
jgi:transposase